MGGRRNKSPARSEERLNVWPTACGDDQCDKNLPTENQKKTTEGEKKEWSGRVVASKWETPTNIGDKDRGEGGGRKKKASCRNGQPGCDAQIPVTQRDVSLETLWAGGKQKEERERKKKFARAVWVQRGMRVKLESERILKTFLGGRGRSRDA